MKPRLIGVAAAALGVGLAAAACSSSGTSASAAAHTHTASPYSSSTPSHMAASGSPASAPNGTAATIGAGCAKLPKSGSGSVSGMASEPVATAIAHNPQLTEFNKAIGVADLTHALNSAKTITVFAPDNAALAALGSGNFKTLMGNKADLTKVIQYHVVPAHVTPTDLAASKPLPTQLGLPVHPVMTGGKYKVNDAEVACGNIPTSNATLYIVNKVLIPTT